MLKFSMPKAVKKNTTLRAEFRRQLTEAAVMAAAARVVTQDAFDRVRELEKYIKSLNLD